MDNQIYIPYLSPLKFVVKDLDYDYSIKHLDVALQRNQIYNFQAKNYYYQKFQNSDTLAFQIVSNFGPCSIELVDCKNAIKATGTLTNISNTYYQIPFVAYKCNIDISAIDEGYYYVQVKFGTGLSLTTLISEPILIAETFDNTVLFEYSHTTNYGGAIFQNGEKFQFRFEAVFQDFQPQSNDTYFEDQSVDLVILSSFKFRTWKLIIGNAGGIADWIADKVLDILGCDMVLIDGKQFCKNQGSKLEPTRDRLTPLAGWSIEVRESKSRNGITISNNVPLDNDVIVTYVVEPYVFGNVSDVNIIKVQ